MCSYYPKAKEKGKVVLKVCMFVRNNFKYDSRVLKEAKTLAEAGYDVRVIAVLDKTTRPYEEWGGFRIIRVPKNPPYYRLLGVTKPPDRFSVYFKCNILSKLIARMKQSFREIDEEITDQGAAGYVREAIRTRPIIFFTLGWIRLLGYYMYRCARSVFPKRIQRSAKALKAYFYSGFKAFLMIFYRSFSFLDYYCCSFQLVRKEPADIYHAHDLNTLPAAYWAKRKMGGKLIYDSHELYVERNRSKKQSRFAKFLLSKIEFLLIGSADHVITVSDSIGEELKRRYPIKRLTVILNVPSHRVAGRALSLREELRIPKDKKIILYVGNVTFNRGLEELIQSIVYLEGCVFVIMGRITNNAYDQQLRKLAKDVSVENKVYYFGPVSSEDVTEYAASAHVGAASIKNACLSYYYCLPNKLFEYIAAGLPVVGSNFPELNKVIKEYNLGRTFNPDDPKDIAEAINYVLSDKDKYEEMKRNALQAAKVFNWENESKKLLEVYKRLEDELNIASN